MIQFIYAQTKTRIDFRFVWFVSESEFPGPKSSFIPRFLSSNIHNSKAVVILFLLIKITAIWSNLFTPKQKLAFICVFGGSLVNRNFRDHKAVLFRDFRLQIFQILGRCDFISFDKNNCCMIQFIYAQTKTRTDFRFAWFVSKIWIFGTKKQFYSKISAFQYSKFLGRCDFISFDENNYYMIQFIYAQTKTRIDLCFVRFVSESGFSGPKSSFIPRFSSSNIPNS
jgi:hypothetical protein